MAVRLQFEGIRCFFDPQSAEIRPITLLVGENSSGKTTFLALCRIAHAISQGYLGKLPFNEHPFSLGAFDQIASKVAGRGQAGSFSICVASGNAALLVGFEPRDGQPKPRQLRLTTPGHALDIAREAGGDAYIVALDPPDDKATETLSRALQRVSLEGVFQPPLTFWLGPGGGHTTGIEAAQMALRHGLQGRLYAFAPVRTSPVRTYDPVSKEPDPEGSHVPYLMATLARSGSKRNWLALQSALAKFGAGSGLFSKIEIVNKGKKESDPFQIGVKSGGPAFNLIDVGYGVSQALPILVDTIQQSSESAFFLLQQPEVHLHPRAQAELGSFFVSQAVKQRKFVIETHSDHLVDRIRMEVRRKKLKPGDVSLLYFERGKHGATIYTIELDDHGGIVSAPPGYRQFFLNEGRDLLGI